MSNDQAGQFKVKVWCLFLFVSCLALHVGGMPVQALAQEPHVYFINNSGKLFLTGFRIKGEKGIVTCLHGVMCVEPGMQITATNAHRRVFVKLELRKIDVDRDLAIISCPEIDSLPADGLDPSIDSGLTTTRGVDVIGYPAPLCFADVTKRCNLCVSRPFQQLKSMVGPEFLNALSRRGSPDPDCRMIFLDGALRPGHSGSPVMDSKDRVVGIVNGGIEKVDIAWAVPLCDVKFIAIKDVPLVRMMQIERAGVPALFTQDSGLEGSLLPALQALGNGGHSPIDEMRSADIQSMPTDKCRKVTVSYTKGFESDADASEFYMVSEGTAGVVEEVSRLTGFYRVRLQGFNEPLWIPSDFVKCR